MDMENVERPKTFEDGLKAEEFKTAHLGQTIMGFELPIKMLEDLNSCFDSLTEDELRKIQSPNGRHELMMYDLGHDINLISDDLNEWIKDRGHQYLQALSVPYIGLQSQIAWMNDTLAGEYIPLHRHFGSPGVYKPPMDDINHPVGLVVLIGVRIPERLKGPDQEHMVRSGMTEFVNPSGPAQFTVPSWEVTLTDGMVLVFPYDMCHTVYPHFSEINRRTYSHNIDVFLGNDSVVRYPPPNAYSPNEPIPDSYKHGKFKYY